MQAAPTANVMNAVASSSHAWRCGALSRMCLLLRVDAPRCAECARRAGQPQPLGDGGRISTITAPANCSAMQSSSAAP